MIRDIKNDVETMSSDEWMSVVFIILGVMVAIIIISAIIIKAKAAQNAACPVQQMKARVIDKERLPGNAIRSFSTLWVMFELENGIRKRMVISGTQDTMVVGDSGTLVWQGDAMISFNRGGQSGGWNSGSATRTTSSVGSQGNIPAWKRIEMMEAEKAKNSQHEETEQTASDLCIFCGAEMAPDQLFCGKCGRRKD